MAYMGYVLAMPPCKMALKSSNGRTCCCQYRSCCGLAERNVRLFQSGAISAERLAELSLDLPAAKESDWGSLPRMWTRRARTPGPTWSGQLNTSGLATAKEARFAL